MENARNTFYLALRDRLTVVNPQRVVVVRGVQRPGILVEENESAGSNSPPDVFVLRWKDCAIDEQHGMPMAEQACEIHYWSEGTSSHGGLDRGRLLAAMDVEVMQILEGRSAAKQNFAVTPPVVMASRIFWTTAKFQPLVTSTNQLSRVARVMVYSLEETSEL